jgi:TorA maturation chaperone TorD
MAKEVTVRTLMDGRVSTYRMLSRLFLKEVDREYLDEMRKMRCPINTGNADVDQGYLLFHSYLSNLWERSLEDLARDYVKVFIGANTTGHSAAYPNESVHTSPERLFMQDARDEVMAIYKANGLKVDDAWSSGEDHIALELEFMATMAERSAKAMDEHDDEKTSSLLMTQYHFLADHLSAWVPSLTKEMLDFASTDFYRALAHLTRGYIEEDQAFLEEVMREEIDAEKGIEDEGAEGAADGEAADAEASADAAGAGEGIDADRAASIIEQAEAAVNEGLAAQEAH